MLIGVIRNYVISTLQLIGLGLSIKESKSEESKVHSSRVVWEEGAAFLCEFDYTFHVGIRAREKTFVVGDTPYVSVERDEEFRLVERFPKTNVHFSVLTNKPTQHEA